MKDIKISKIIEYIVNLNVVWNRVYFWQPINEPNQDYITINIISEQQPRYNKGTLLEFAFLGGTERTTFNTLLGYRLSISNNITWPKTWFDCYWVNEDGWFINWYDDKNRKVVKQDYRFYFVK